MQVEIKNTENKGRGVFAKVLIQKGTKHISEGIYLLPDQLESKSPLWMYVFNAPKSGEIVSLDWTSLMNDDKNPNLDYKPISNTQIEFVALRDIYPGEELTINYGYDIEDHTKELEIDLDAWNEATIGGVTKRKDELTDQLKTVRTQLHDAPSEVKRSFNNVVEYFVGMCPESGCIEQDSEGNWRIISNKTGEYWKQKYESREKAENALKAYHANRG